MTPWIPQISFHKLTELISKNWATIDEESKSYCTKLSEMSRKRYKENMNKFNASRKILELKQEKSIMLAATENSQMKQVGTPPRAKATRPLLRTTIHAVTPDRSYSSKSSDEHPPKQPVVTPSYNPHANRRPVSYPPPAPYYGYGTSPPPPLPPSPPPMPTQVLPQYHPTYARIPSPLPSTMPSPMASRSSPNYHGYGQYYYPYKPHKNYYPPYKNAHYSNTHETRRSVYNYYNQESMSSSYAPPPDHHWNYPAHLVSAIYKPYKHICNSHDGKYDYDCYAASSQRQDSTCKRGNHSSPEAPQNYSKTQGDSTNIHSMMSFDSPKSNQIEFDLSFENLKACQSKEQKLEGNEASNHGAYANGSQEEDEESIMGWLREGLLPVDTGGIPF